MSAATGGCAGEKRDRFSYPFGAKPNGPVNHASALGKHAHFRFDSRQGELCCIGLLHMQCAKAVNDSPQSIRQYRQDGTNTCQQKYRGDGELDYVNDTGCGNSFKH